MIADRTLNEHQLMRLRVLRDYLTLDSTLTLNETLKYDPLPEVQEKLSASYTAPGST